MARHSVVPALFPPPGYAHTALVAAGEQLAFLAGGVPLDPAGALVGPGDHVAQARQVLANLAVALAHVGSGLEHVVASTVYVVADAPGPLSEVWEVVLESGLSAGPHTSTLLGVSTLGYTGQLVEITVTAVVPSTAAVEG
ncbi:endoribonuclease [Kitasatospora sp. MMS16-BH015]|uniref:RidA family protein n=1 Tax=Kitasatospora sp. MMS16-BH015 TaxID=2018025 RepID=UPI000CA346DF|nr:RidA family protein [Kitasatospora sp. MMS16-BH015]AUG80035.1 endoribonuclease [Kitasatospora sp. MMS16-BH015]